eukprot:TRINITY_DN178_c0_g1_i2.p1 TRINITY_DN178_c0_g1~~TRINITY_DN178_c0_g1_i2.p1  ORF type:complete len:1189 (-),score=249.17 TRINITY_DN178_c0_g1_i2:1894-5460(-)
MPVYTFYRWRNNNLPSTRELVQYHERDIKLYNSVNAMTALADLLRNGKGVRRDAARALQLYERAATCQCPTALVIYAQVLIYGVCDVKPDWRRAAALLDHTIDEFESTVAMQELSYILERGGHGLRRDRARALQLLERCLHMRQSWKRTDREIPEIMCQIAHMVTSALPGFPFDMKRGLQLYKRAFKIDPQLSTQMQQLARLYAEGRPRFPADIAQAAKWFKRACPELSLLEATLELAERLADGETGKHWPNPQTAIAIYKHAIEHHQSSTAVRKLAELLVKDTTDPEKPRQAVRMLERLALEEHDDTAVYDLARILQHGTRGVPSDPVRACRLLEQAAERHDAFVLTLLSDISRRGAKGVPRDIPKAIKLLEDVLEKESDLYTLCRLADILQEDADDVPTDETRAQLLFERAIEENERVGLAYWGLACLLERKGGKGAETLRRIDHLYASALKSDSMVLSVIAYRFVTSLSTSHPAFVPVNKKRIMSLYDTYRERGDDGSVLTWFGSHLETGYKGVQKNKKKAIRMYEKAISKFRETSAMLKLAKMLLAGDGVTKDVKRAVSLLERAIEGGNTDAMWVYGQLLENGDAVPMDIPKALKLFRQASEAGDTSATHALALMYTLGNDCVEVNKREAARLYERLIEEGDVEAHVLYEMASLLFEGDGIEKDVPRSLKLFEQAIELSGHRDSMICLASALEDGTENVEMDKKRAFELYERAIREHDDPTAMNNLALMLEDGVEGIAMDRVRSLMLYKKSIEIEPDAIAILNLAQLVNHGGGGVQRNLKEAKALYERGIALGESKHGPYNYGRYLMDDCFGGEENEAKAVELFATSAANGSDDARWWLAKVLCTSSQKLDKSAEEAMKDIEEYVEKNVCAKQLVNLGSFKFYLNRQGKADVAEAEKLFKRAIDEFDDELARICLACLLFGQDDCTENVERGLELLEQVIERSSSTCGKAFLASVLCSGFGCAKYEDAQRAIKLCEEEIRRHENRYSAAPLKGILASLLKVQQFGNEGGFERAVALCEEGMQQRDELLSKLALANLLSDGPEERRDVTRAEALYKEVIEEQWNIFLGCSPWTWLRASVLEAVVADDGLDRRKLRFVAHDPRSLARLNVASLCFERGDGEEGVRHLRDAVEKDDSVMGMVQLSRVLRSGLGGVNRDEEEAVRLMERVRAKRSWMPKAAWQLCCAV